MGQRKVWQILHLHLLRTLALALESRLQMCETSAPFFSEFFRFVSARSSASSFPHLSCKKTRKTEGRCRVRPCSYLPQGHVRNWVSMLLLCPAASPLRNLETQPRKPEVHSFQALTAAYYLWILALLPQEGSGTVFFFGCFSTGFGSWSRGCLFSAALGDHRALQSGQEPSPNCTRQAQGLLKTAFWKSEARLAWIGKLGHGWPPAWSWWCLSTP